MANGYLDSAIEFNRSEDLSTIVATDSFGSEVQNALGSLLVRGLGFSLTHDFDNINEEGKEYLKITTGSNYVMTTDRELVTDVERVFYKVYDYTATEDLDVIETLEASKLRRDSSIETEVTFQFMSGNPTVGTPFIKLPVFGYKASNRYTSGDVSVNQTARILAPSSTYMVEIENDSDDNAYVAYDLIYYEIPFGCIPSV